MKAKRPKGFRNVDLDIVSSTSLDSLAEELGKLVIVLYSGKGACKERLLCLESLRFHNNPDSAVRDLCGVIEQLSPVGRKAWTQARRKEFNVGYDLLSGSRMVQVVLKPETVHRIVSLGATVAFTCYRGEEDVQG